MTILEDPYGLLEEKSFVPVISQENQIIDIKVPYIDFIFGDRQILEDCDMMVQF